MADLKGLPEARMSRMCPLMLRQRHIVVLILAACATTVLVLNRIGTATVQMPRHSQHVEHFVIGPSPTSQNLTHPLASTLVERRNKLSSVFEPKWTYEYTSALCKGNDDPYMAEDLFCMNRPEFLEHYKNPCWLAPGADGKNKVTCMPFFHLLGADKCGSTDLFDRILQHPEMEPAGCGLHKECYYWCWTRYGVWMKNNTVGTRKTFERYLRLFEQSSKNIHLREEDGYHSHITGEGTPMDLWDFRGWPRIPQNYRLKEPMIMTPHLMKHMYPNPKLLVILRNPTDRLYSDYYFLGYGSSPMQFHRDAIRAVAMIENCVKEKTIKQCIFDMDMYVNLPMRIHISMYSVVMKEWMAVFPRESFLVLRNEDYGNDIKNHMKMVFEFLTLSRLPESDLDVLSNAKRKHVTQSKKNKGPMMEATRILLDKFFAPFNEELAILLNDDRFLWKDKPAH